MWRPREGQEENAIEGWLERIRLRIGDDARVMIVATHCKERHPELDYPELQERFGQILVGNHQVDNRDGTGIPELKGAIGNAAAKLPQMGERMSARWIIARDEIQSLPEPQIERRSIDAICHHQGMDDRETETLIDLLHDFGHVIYFGDDEGLRDVVVLQPEWLTKAIGYVLEDQPTLNAQGELDHARLREIWWDHRRGDWDRYPPNYHRYFLRLMEKFDICYRIPDRERSLVGQLVPHMRPSLPWTRNELPSEGNRELALVGEFSSEAPGLMAWLTVRNHRFSTNQHWRRGVFLAHPAYASDALMELVGRSRLHLTVRAPSPDYFFSILRDSIEELIELRWEGLRCEFWVPCTTMANDGARCPGRFNFRKLLHRREHGRPSVECDECFQEFDVQRLLTGFSQAAGSIDEQLDRVVQLVERVDHRTQRIEQTAAEAANSVRATLTLLSHEVTDCPRLFVLRPKDKKRWSPARVWESDYALTLCCEHPGHEHLWFQATYEISRSREGLQKAGPYISVVSKTLRIVVPIAGALAGTMMDEVTQKDLADEMKLMDRIAGALPSDIDVDREAVEESEQFTSAQGEGLRALRQLLLELDKPRSFGGMRRVVTASGDVLWVCPEHYPEYDPGLPDLPCDTAEA